MRKGYKIISNSEKIYNKLSYDGFEELIDVFHLYNVEEPFNIVDNNGLDHTDEFISYLNLAGYKSLDLKKTTQHVPPNLLETIDKYWESDFIIKPQNINNILTHNSNLELLPVEDLKSPTNFMNLWKQHLVTIGFIDNHNFALTISLNPKDTKVYLIDSDCTNKDDVTNDLIVAWDSHDDFINYILKNKNIH